MIQVAHVISDMNIGGAGIHLCNLLATADRDRFSYTVFLPQNSQLVPRIASLHVPMIELRGGADSSCDFLACSELISHFGRRRPHIVHTHASLSGRIAARVRHVPVILNTRHCADMNQPKASFAQQSAINALNRLLQGHTIATAHYVKEVLIRQGYAQDHITVIPNGSAPPSILSEQEKKILRDSLGLLPTDLAVGIVARLARGKGHEVFLRAANICTQQNPAIRFFIIGSGERETELKSLAADLGLSRSVQFLGFRTDAPRFMNILDLNINCSQTSETSSLALSEGMSVGSIPIVSHCGGNPYMAGFGENGIVFPINDHQQLADAILTLANHPERRYALSEACKKRFSEHFTAAHMTSQTEALYLRLLAAKHLDIGDKI